MSDPYKPPFEMEACDQCGNIYPAKAKVSANQIKCLINSSLAAGLSMDQIAAELLERYNVTERE